MKIIAIIIIFFICNLALAKENQMNEEDQYIFDLIKVHVWAGFDTPDEVQEMISDVLEEGADEDMLRKSVATEFQKKFEDEKSWPKITDFDRLDSAFKALKSRGILCLHNAGYTMSDGHDDSIEAVQEYPEGQFFGYCFYHGQDLERALSGYGLMLAYDHVKGDVPEKINVAKVIQEELEKAGFTTDWDGTTNKKINIPNIDWKKRTSSQLVVSSFTKKLIELLTFFKS
jgi:hypothetical protein